jgi:formyltetrahydrofolate synthetase
MKLGDILAVAGLGILILALLISLILMFQELEINERKIKLLDRVMDFNLSIEKVYSDEYPAEIK